MPPPFGIGSPSSISRLPNLDVSVPYGPPAEHAASSKPASASAPARRTPLEACPLPCPMRIPRPRHHDVIRSRPEWGRRGARGTGAVDLVTESLPRRYSPCAASPPAYDPEEIGQFINGGTPCNAAFSSQPSSR